MSKVRRRTGTSGSLSLSRTLLSLIATSHSQSESRRGHRQPASWHATRIRATQTEGATYTALLRISIHLDQRMLNSIEALAARLHHPTHEALLAYLVSEGLNGTQATLQRADAMDSAPAGDAQYG